MRAKSVVAGLGVVVLLMAAALALGPAAPEQVDSASSDASGDSTESADQLTSNTTAPEVTVAANRTAVDGTVVRLSASDSSAGPVSYTWTQTAGPSTALMAEDTATPWLVTPEGHSTRTLRFRVEASKGESTTTATTSVTVEPNDPPVARANGPHQTTEADSFLLTGTETDDPDGDSLTYEWVQTGGPTAEVGDTTGSTLAVTAPRVTEATELTFELRVVDAHGQRGVATTDITVFPDADSQINLAGENDTLVASDEDRTATQGESTHYQVDIVEGEPLVGFGDAASDGFYSDQERLVQWAWAATGAGVTERGRPSTLHGETAQCLQSERIGVDGATASVTVTVADGCAIELSLVTYIMPHAEFDRTTASQQELYDATTATVGPGTYTFTVRVPDSE